MALHPSDDMPVSPEHIGQTINRQLREVKPDPADGPFGDAVPIYTCPECATCRERAFSGMRELGRRMREELERRFWEAFTRS